MVLFRIEIDGVRHLARGSVEDGPTELLPSDVTLDALLAAGTDALGAASRWVGVGPIPDGARLLAPLEGQEVWAAGVTYRRSRQARMDESTAPDHYARVYEAERPELFFKAAAGRSRGPEAPIAIRADSGWDVPEPELGLVLDARGQVAGYVVGNDVSSRSIEGENPLYLPQAKVYDGSCAVGPGIVPVDEAPPLEQMRIALRVERQSAPVFVDEVAVADLHRTPADLATWLFRASSFPVGVVLLTGTSIVPDPDFTLIEADVVEITLPGIGTLRNPVEVVGRTTVPPVAATGGRL